MDTQDIISLVIGILGIGGAVFAIFFKVTNPQIALEKEQIKTEKDIEDKATILSQKDVENKASLLEQQVKWEKEANEKRFIEMGLRLDRSLTLAENHTHTVDTKVDTLIKNVGDMDSRFGKELIRLATILEERLPNCK